MGLNDSDAELENLRQQLRFASTRLEEERAGHKGTLRLLEESRKRARTPGRRGRRLAAARRAGGDSDEKEQAVARLAELEATVAELRAELEARDGELAAGAEIQTQLAAEAARPGGDDRRAPGRAVESWEHRRARAGAVGRPRGDGSLGADLGEAEGQGEGTSGAARGRASHIYQRGRLTSGSREGAAGSSRQVRRIEGCDRSAHGAGRRVARFG